MEIVIVAAVVLIAGVGAFGFLLYRSYQVYSLVEYERIAVFKETGEFSEIRGPGRIRIARGSMLNLFGVSEQVRDQYGRVALDPDDEKSRFDLRETSIRLGDAHCITRDSAVVNIPPAIIYKITDPQKLVLNINNHHEALENSVNATLRAVVGSMSLTEVITGRESIVSQMTSRLAEEANRWGIRVVSVEVQDIKPDPQVEQAMNERRSAEEQAERERQELVVAAEARRQGAIADNDRLVADAEAKKQASILEAEAEKQSAIIRAEGEKETEAIRSETTTSFYKELMELGVGADIALRYEQIQALRNLGGSGNSKLVILPTDMTVIQDPAEHIAHRRLFRDH